MDLSRLLIRMMMIVRNPPSRQKLVVMTVVLVVTLGLAAIQKAGWAPDWMQADRVRTTPR